MSKIKEAFQRFCSLALSVTTTLWLSGLTLLLPVSPVLAVTPGQYGLKEGDLIRAPSLAAPEGWKVYIINQAGYKRHIYNPDVFNIYGHLKWSNVKDVSADTVNAFTTSDLYRVDGGDGKVYSVDANGVKHHVNVTAADFVTKGYKWDQVYVINSAEGNYYTVGSEVTTGPGVTPPPATGGLSVSVSPSTPAGTVLAGGTVFNNVLTLRFTAGSAAASITGLTITKDGLIQNNWITGVSVWQGTSRQGNILTSLTSDGKATFSFGTAIAIPANSTVDLDVKANLSASATSGTFAFKVGAASDISLSGGATVSGTFPVMGNGFNVVNSGAIGSYTITAQAVGGNTTSGAAANLDIGTSQKEAGKMQFNETTGREDILISQITIYVEGSTQEKDLTNWKLKGPDGALLAENPTKSWPYVTFTLATAYRVPEGVTRTLSVFVDPVDGADRYFRIHIQNDYDVLIRGNETGAYIAPASFSDQSASDGFWRLKQGALTVTLTSGSPSGNIAVGTQDAVLAKFDLKAVGEQLEIRKMDLEIVEASSSTVEQLTGNLKVQSDDGAVTYLSLAADTTNLQRTSDTMESTRFDLNTYIVIPSGTTKTLKVVGTLKTTATSAQTYKASIGNFYTYRASTKDFTDLLTSTVGQDGNTLTVQTSALTISKNTSVADKNVAIGANNMVLGSFVFQAGSAEGLNISSITVTYNEDPSDEITNVAVYAKSVQFGSTIGTPAATSDSFSGTLSVAKSETVTVEVKGNVKSDTALANGTVVMKISGVSATGQTTSNSITAKNTSGTAISSSVTVDGQTITYKTGTLQITKDAASPVSKIIIAGTTGVELEKLRFEALNDTLTLKKIRFEANASGSGKYFSKLYLCDGTSDTTSACATGVSLLGDEATFDGLTVSLVAGTPKTLSVKADLAATTIVGASGDIKTVAVQIKSDTPTGADPDLLVSGTQGNLGTHQVNCDSGDTCTSAGNDADTDIAVSNSFLFHLTAPTITKTTVPTTDLSAVSSNFELYKFTVQSANANVPLNIGELKIKVTQSGFASPATLLTFKLYKGTELVAQDTTTVIGNLGTASSTATLAFNQSNEQANAFDSAGTNDANFDFDEGIEISSSALTFTLKADTTDVLDGKATGTVSVTTELEGTAGVSSGDTTQEAGWANGNLFYSYKRQDGSNTYIGSGAATTTSANHFSGSDSYSVGSQTISKTL